MKNMTLRCVIVVAAVVAASLTASASTIYATSLEGSQIVKWDTVTNTVTPVFSTPSSADSLVFDSQGRIIYTELNAGQIWRYDPVANTNTMIVGGLNLPADMVLEPGGNSLLVSQFNGGVISRVNLTTDTITQTSPNYCNPEGLAYIGGNLYANIGCRDSGAPTKQLARLDPTTLTIMATSAIMPEIDGLTYDSFSGHLFGSMLFNSMVNEFDPTTLAVIGSFNTGGCQPDGITADGNGNIIVASRCSGQIQMYNEISHTSTYSPFINGLDDVAPASGLGSLNPVPEPATFVLLGTSLAPLVFRRKFRK